MIGNATVEAFPIVFIHRTLMGAVLQKEGRKAMVKHVWVLLLSAALLSACGVKPKNLDAPTKAGESFPHQYPKADK
ncbi:MAG: hypothetical protein ACOYK8_01595 [Alphaproteobacteria bacterium]